MRNGCAFVLLALMGGCAYADRTPPPSVDTSPGREFPIVYRLGFYPAERGPDGSMWHWMGGEAVVRLANTHQDMIITIKGNTPRGAPEPQTLSLEFNGQPLDRIVGVRGAVAKEYEIAADRQGRGEFSRLRIQCSPTFVPHQLDPSSGDQRRLGFVVYEFEWQTK